MAHQRARGALVVGFKRRGAATVLDRLRQDGCLKARFPRVEPGEAPCAVSLNSAGGIAPGDRLSVLVQAGAGTRAVVASQAAERVYRALPGMVAEVGARLEVAEGAALEWLPQETILFDGSALRRRLEIELAENAEFTGVESLVFGRAAMGEVVTRGSVLDRITLRRAGRLVLHDAVRMEGGIAALLGRAAVGQGARAVATLLHVGAAADAGLVERVRAALAGWDAGVSLVEGVLVARIVAPGGASLRAGVVAGLNVVRGGRRLPRVWDC